MNYNPGISYRGDQWIMQGGQQMAGAMTALLQYMLARGQQKQQLQAEAEAFGGPDDQAGASAPVSSAGIPPGSEGDNGGSGGFNPVMPGTSDGDNGPSPAAQRGIQADAWRKLIMSYAPDAKDFHQAIKGMSVDQLEGAVRGWGRRQAAAEMQAKLEDYAAQANLRREQAMDDQTVGDFVQTYGRLRAGGMQPDGTTLPGREPEEAGMLAFSMVPRAGGRVLPKAIEAIGNYEKVLHPAPGEDLTPGTYTVPNTGATFAFRGKQFLPAGVDPTVAQAQEPQAHFDDQGKVTGFSTFDPKKGWVFKEAKNTGLKRATLEDGSTLPGYVQSADGKLHDTRTAMEKAFGAGGVPGQGNAGPDAGKAYKTADDVKAAVKSGKLKRDDALKILRSQFGMK